MNREKKLLIVLSLFGMELSWIYAWAFFVMMTAFHRSLPLSAAICSSGLALLLTAFSRGRGWRWIQVIGVQGLGLGLVCLWTLYQIEQPPFPFVNSHWIGELLSSPKGLLQWASLVLLIFWTLFFWIGGILLARRPGTYDSISNRFDLGAGALLFLLLIELVMLVKGGTKPAGALGSGQLLAFFIFSLLAFCLTRSSSDGRKGYVAGYRGISTIVGFMAIILFFAAAMVSFLLPYITRTAEAGYGVLKTVWQPLSQVIITVLRFLFSNKTIQTDASRPSHGPQGHPSRVWIKEGGWIDSLMDILGWVLLGIGVLAALLLISILLWILLKRLLARTTRQERPPDAWQKLICWLLNMPPFVMAAIVRFQSWLKGPQTAVQIYLALVLWGRRSGIPPLPSDTPLEYGSRLRKNFPAVDREIQSIITSHNSAVYGRRSDIPNELAYAKTALHRLSSPTLWPARLRSCLFPAKG